MQGHYHSRRASAPQRQPDPGHPRSDHATGHHGYTTAASKTASAASGGIDCQQARRFASSLRSDVCSTTTGPALISSLTEQQQRVPATLRAANSFGHRRNASGVDKFSPESAKELEVGVTDAWGPTPETSSPLTHSIVGRSHQAGHYGSKVSSNDNNNSDGHSTVRFNATHGVGDVELIAVADCTKEGELPHVCAARVGSYRRSCSRSSSSRSPSRNASASSDADGRRQNRSNKGSQSHQQHRHAHSYLAFPSSHSSVSIGNYGPLAASNGNEVECTPTAFLLRVSGMEPRHRATPSNSSPVVADPDAPRATRYPITPTAASVPSIVIHNGDAATSTQQRSFISSFFSPIDPHPFRLTEEEERELLKSQLSDVATDGRSWGRSGSAADYGVHPPTLANQPSRSQQQVSSDSEEMSAEEKVGVSSGSGEERMEDTRRLSEGHHSNGVSTGTAAAPLCSVAKVDESGRTATTVSKESNAVTVSVLQTNSADEMNSSTTRYGDVFSSSSVGSSSCAQSPALTPANATTTTSTTIAANTATSVKVELPATPAMTTTDAGATPATGEVAPGSTKRPLASQSERDKGGADSLGSGSLSGENSCASPPHICLDTPVVAAEEKKAIDTVANTSSYRKVLITATTTAGSTGTTATASTALWSGANLYEGNAAGTTTVSPATAKTASDSGRASATGSRMATTSESLSRRSSHSCIAGPLAVTTAADTAAVTMEVAPTRHDSSWRSPPPIHVHGHSDRELLMARGSEAIDDAGEMAAPHSSRTDTGETSRQPSETHSRASPRASNGDAAATISRGLENDNEGEEEDSSRTGDSATDHATATVTSTAAGGVADDLLMWECLCSDGTFDEDVQLEVGFADLEEEKQMQNAKLMKTRLSHGPMLGATVDGAASSGGAVSEIVAPSFRSMPVPGSAERVGRPRFSSTICSTGTHSTDTESKPIFALPPAVMATAPANPTAAAVTASDSSSSSGQPCCTSSSGCGIGAGGGTICPTRRFSVSLPHSISDLAMPSTALSPVILYPGAAANSTSSCAGGIVPHSTVTATAAVRAAPASAPATVPTTPSAPRSLVRSPLRNRVASPGDSSVHGVIAATPCASRSGSSSGHRRFASSFLRRVFASPSRDALGGPGMQGQTSLSSPPFYTLSQAPSLTANGGAPHHISVADGVVGNGGNCSGLSSRKSNNRFHSGYGWCGEDGYDDDDVQPGFATPAAHQNHFGCQYSFAAPSTYSTTSVPAVAATTAKAVMTPAAPPAVVVSGNVSHLASEEATQANADSRDSEARPITEQHDLRPPHQPRQQANRQPLLTPLAPLTITKPTTTTTTAVVAIARAETTGRSLSKSMTPTPPSTFDASRLFAAGTEPVQSLRYNSTTPTPVFPGCSFGGVGGSASSMNSPSRSLCGSAANSLSTTAMIAGGGLECSTEMMHEPSLLDDPHNRRHFTMRALPEVVRRMPRGKLLRGPGFSMQAWTALVCQRRNERLAAAALDAGCNSGQASTRASGLVEKSRKLESGVYTFANPPPPLPGIPLARLTRAEVTARTQFNLLVQEEQAKRRECHERDADGDNAESLTRADPSENVKAFTCDGGYVIDPEKRECLMVLRGVVYDVYSLLAFHPGGAAVMLDCEGKDATAVYDCFHAWINCESMLGPYAVGILDKDE